METALILFLLGIGGLAAGILIGRYYVPDDRMLKRTARHAKSYARALNHLLARDRDAAVDELRRVVEENVDDVEPYFALAALFRNRGEWERAIRVHQAIELREAGDKRVCLRSRYELGLDFRAAGMPRRATRAMEDVLAADSKHEGALRALCGLYEEQGRYHEAASTWQRLRKIGKTEPTEREHHLLVASAQTAMAAGDLDSAKRFLADAERVRSDTPHLLAAWAQLSALRGRPKRTSDSIENLLNAAPVLASQFVPSLVEAQREIARQEAQKRKEAVPAESAFTETAIRRAAAILATLDVSSDPHVRLAAAELKASYDVDEAVREFRIVAAEHESLLQARVAAARLALQGEDETTVRDELDALAAPEGALAWVGSGRWLCAACGHHHSAFFWRCSACRRWGTTTLDVGASVEVSPQVRDRRALPRGPELAVVEPGRALPEPSLDSGLTVDEWRDVSRRLSVFGRVGSWFSTRLGRG